MDATPSTTPSLTARPTARVKSAVRMVVEGLAETVPREQPALLTTSAWRNVFPSAETQPAEMTDAAGLAGSAPGKERCVLREPAVNPRATERYAVTTDAVDPAENAGMARHATPKVFVRKNAFPLATG